MTYDLKLPLRPGTRWVVTSNLILRSEIFLSFPMLEITISSKILQSVKVFNVVQFFIYDMFKCSGW